MIGKWIQSLSAEQKDRIIEGQEWCNEHFHVGDARCLVGHAFNLGTVLEVNLFRTGWGEVDGASVGPAFDSLCDRFGRDRIVRACKLRAARPAVVMPVETVEAGNG